MTQLERMVYLDKAQDAVPEFAKKVQPIYQLLDWKWSTKDGKEVEPYIPSVEDIKISLMRDIIAVAGGSISSKSGGLKVELLEPSQTMDRCQPECRLIFEVDKLILED